MTVHFNAYGGIDVPDDAFSDTPPIRQSLRDLNVREYVVVPRTWLPARFVLMARALTHHYAGELAIPAPAVHYFAEMTPELETPWLDRIAPELRTSWFFRDTAIKGFAEVELARIWIEISLTGACLVDTIAHEVGHIAGHDEVQARHYGRRAGAAFGGG